LDVASIVHLKAVSKALIIIPFVSNQRMVNPVITPIFYPQNTLSYSKNVWSGYVVF
jgi:hypothetical protein